LNPFGQKLSSLNRTQKQILLWLNDVSLGFIAWVTIGPPLLTFFGGGKRTPIIEIISTLYLQFIVPILVAISFLTIFGFYKSLIRFFDSMDSIMTSIIGCLIFGFGSWGMYIMYVPQNVTPVYPLVFLYALLLSSVFYALINLSRDTAKIILHPYKKEANAKPVLIYGAGAVGKELMQAIQMDRTKELIAFFDDSKDLKDRSINNIPIFGSFSKLKQIKQNNPDIEVLLAIPSLDINRRREVISTLEELKISVRTVPAFHELIFDSKKMSDIQNLSLNDILPGRRVDELKIKDCKDREFLITGSGGSIGSEIVRQILLNDPKRIILFDISEFNLFKILEESRLILDKHQLTTELVPILGDIKDQSHLKHLFDKHQIDTIYHAAAYKHVPLVENENNISKSIENNLIGTYILAKKAIEFGVKSFVLVSTDKAVRPTNIMGASKRLAEIAIQALNDANSGTKLCMVRFGNVINSSGSVIPLFLDQIAKGGPVTLTDRQVQRYFMTIPEASSLVIQAGEMSIGGEVFILDMGKQMKIIDLAKRLIHLSGRSVAGESGAEGIEIVEVGLRPGEKLYEELLISGDEEKTMNSKIFKSNEDFITLKEFENILLVMQEAIANDDVGTIVNNMKKYVSGFNNDKAST
tara:strand:- start:17382 stop:19298 length:1917 start_codon:yes stop_codon:yes gene_type:complete